MGREFELKYAATAEAQAAIRAAYGPWREIRMETTYFDTPDGALSAHRMTLRLRKENDATVCTLKTPLPDGSRGEWECLTTDIGDGIRALMAMGAPKRLAGLTVNDVIPRCGARFTRHSCTIDLGDALVELALDQGVLLGGNREIPLCEVEAELKAGSRKAVVQFAAALAARFGMQPEPHSKFRRASALAEGESL